MYKFFGKPNQTVNSKVTGKFVFQFNTKGEFITDDEDIINRAKGFFDYQEITVESTGDKKKAKKKPEGIKIETKE